MLRAIVDGADHLIAADPPLADLQKAKGGRVGGKLALPEVADVVKLARRLDMPVTREAKVDGQSLWITAEKDDDLVRLAVEPWAGPKSAAASANGEEPDGIDDALRSPVDRIIAAADGIAGEADGPLQSDYATYGADIAAAGRHLLSVIRSMGARIGMAPEEETADLRKLGLEACSLLQSKADAKKVDLSFAPGQNEVRVKGSKSAILQILVNILSNAVRHTPENSRICIEFPKEAGKGAISVTDDGPGIAPWDQERIFEAYERAHDDDDGGKGLGLAIALRLARDNGGDITLESPPGQGACFTLTLPAAG